jgi:hypothetical protein
LPFCGNLFKDLSSFTESDNKYVLLMIYERNSASYGHYSIK